MMIVSLKQTFMFCISLALVFTPLSLLKPNYVYAAIPPINSTSYYMGTVDEDTHYGIGYAIGINHRNRSGKDEAIILDYGGQNSTGTGATLRTNPDATYAQIRDAVVQVARGYYVGTGSDLDSQLLIIVGTNNSAYQVTSTGGEAWAEMVNEIGEDTEVYDSQVSIAGGNDMEIDFATATKTRNWANGYEDVNDYPYYNYGDAAGCTTSVLYDGEDDLDCVAYENTWSMSDYILCIMGCSISYGSSSNL
ncbi:hypothetical protein V3851_04575 [Paenibacillus sp. M1]|uniref:Uncharacterized protein n=1 Tax=Paenibacillus haidiansis TaxID=1574488 RepID=A0ABU7VNZ0_9BACL